MQGMIEWFKAHGAVVGTGLGVLGLVMFVGSLLLLPVLVARMPADYFVRTPLHALPRWDVIAFNFGLHDLNNHGKEVSVSRAIHFQCVFQDVFSLPENRATARGEGLGVSQCAYKYNTWLK